MIMLSLEGELNTLVMMLLMTLMIPIRKGKIAMAMELSAQV